MRLLDRLFSKQVIVDACLPDAGPYLTRYHVWRSRRFGIYIHYFHRSDNDRHLHDHPWAFVTVLLSSGYWEHVNERCYVADSYHGGWIPAERPVRHWRHRFTVLVRPAYWTHRVEIVKPCWTLVLRGPVVRDWGFWTERGWLHWRRYGTEGCE